MALAVTAARFLVSPFGSIRDDFALLDEWEDRYRYVIELGHRLEPLERGGA